MFRAMVEAGEAPPTGMADCVVGDATRLPFPDGTFDRIIASEVMEHIPDDTGALDELVRMLKPGGMLAVTVPAWLSETICWTLSDEYYAPKSVGGHVRIYTEVAPALADGRRRSRTGGRPPRPRAPHALLVAEVRRRADATTTSRWSSSTTRCSCGTSPRRRSSPASAERVLNPVLGKSLVVYATKPWASASVGVAAEPTTAAAPLEDVHA